MGVLNTVRSGLNVLFTPVLYGVVASLALQLSTWEKGDRTQDKLQDANNPDRIKAGSDTFDFIVVGGGTAGSVVVNRLSEYYNVLLLEAGGEPNPLVYVPGLARNLVGRQEVDWVHKTVAQKRACLLAQFKRATWSGGKGLGGSGNLGWMVSLRGNPRDFDNWAKLVDDEGWGYQRLRKYFRKHENFVGNTTDPEAHAQGGELTIQLPDYRPLAQEFVAAGKELGYPNLDLNGRFTEGFDEIFYPSKKGEKLTTYKTFVETIKRRDNLTIRKFATVTKLLFRKADNSVYGVEYERHGKKYIVYANREVILSAGAIQSPKLLLHSGIGPTRHLEDVGIKPLIDLPVGRNLQDHLSVYLGPFFIKEPLSFDFDRDVTAKSFFEYGTFGTGPVTTTGFTATGLFASSFAKLREEKGWPDLQLLMHGVSVHANYASDMAHAYGLNEEVLKKYYKHASGQHSFHIVISLSRPYARGEVRLASKNPTNPIIIDPKYFEDPWDFDVKTMVEGVKKSLEIVEGTRQFQGLGGRFTTEVVPGCEKQKFRSDDYWECYVRQLTVSMHNPVGTCTMGPVGSPHTVVDTQLSVVGAPGLRVVDSSVMPSIVVGGTQQATIAIAEKGAEHILEYWRKRGSAPLQKIVKQQEQSGSSREQVYSSSEVMSVKTTMPPPTLPPTPSPTYFPQIVTTPTSSNFLQGFTLNPETSQNWQNTLDQLAAFSKQIQQTLQGPNLVPPSPSPPKPQYRPTPKATTTMTTTTTTTKATTTSSTARSTNKPQLIFFHPMEPTASPMTPSVGVTYHTPTETTTPLVYVPIISLPTQQVKISSHSPTPKVTTYRPPHTFTSSGPTTFRPREHKNFNTSMFTVNVPIIKADYKHGSYNKPIIQTQPSSVKIYTASSAGAPHKLIQNIVRKEHHYQKFTPPKATPVLRPETTTTTTTTTTPRPTTTTRRAMFEMIHSQVLPQGYQNYIEVPVTSVEYQQIYNSLPQTERPTRPPPPRTTTTTRPPTTKPTKSPIELVPAVHMTASALETTTTRYTVPGGLQNFPLNQIQSIPHNMFLTGLQPYSLVDVTTATEVPNEYTTARSTTIQAPSLKQKQVQEQRKASTEQKNPIFYVIRKKDKQVDPFPDYSDIQMVRPQAPHPPRNQQQHHHSHHQRMRRPDPRSHHHPFHRKPPSRPHPQQRRPTHSQTMHTAQSQRHYPLVALPPSHFTHPQRQRVQHYVTTVEDHHGQGSTQIHAVLPNPHQNTRGSGRGGASVSSEDSLDGIITPAISSQLFQQSVLNQLIPIQK